MDAEHNNEKEHLRSAWTRKHGTHFDRDGFFDFVGFFAVLVGPALVIAGLIIALGLAFGAWAVVVSAVVFFAIATWLTFQVPD